MGKDFRRSFGIEIECIAPVLTTRDEVASVIRGLNVPCVAIDRRQHFRMDAWGVKTDGSLMSDWGVEIVSPPLRGELAFYQIEQVCQALSRLRCQISSQCGLHVHIDSKWPVVMDLSAYKRLAKLYIEHELIIDAVMPTWRRGNDGGAGYCCGFRDVSLKKVDDCASVDELVRVLFPRLTATRGNRQRNLVSSNDFRYVKLNFVPVSRTGTIEFRHHSGTIDASKIINWVCACQRMIEYAASSTDQQISREAKQVVQAVKRGTKRAIVYDMLLRPEGCTHEEVLAATGWKMVSIAGIAHYYGLSIRRNRKDKRYFASQPGDPQFSTGRPPPRSPTYYEGDVAPLRRGRRLAARGPQTVLSTRSDTRAWTIEEFCQKLQMDEDEAKFWVTRAAYFAQASMNISPTPGPGIAWIS